MPRTDYGLPLLALIAAACWAAAAAAFAADLSAVAAPLAIAPAVVGAYRDRRLGPGLALAGAALFGAIALTFGAPLPMVALGTAAVAGLGLLVAATIGTAAGEASAYRVWYHGLRDRLPAATLFFMPATGRVHDLNDRAVALLGPLQTRSLAEAFEDPDAYAAFATDDRDRRGRAPRRPASRSRRQVPLVRALGRDGDPDPRGRLRRRPDGRAVGCGRARRERGRAPGARGPRPGCGPARRRGPRVSAAGGDALALLAGSDQPVQGRTLWTAFPERIAQALEPLARLAAFGTPGTGELDTDGRRFLLAAAPVPGDEGTVAGAALAATDVTALSTRLDECEEQRSLANALLAVNRADGTDAAERLLTAALRMTGSRYGAVLRVDGDALTPLAISPALADADLAVLVGDAVRSGVPAVRETAPDAPLPLRRILAVPVGENGVVTVADRASALFRSRGRARLALAEEGFEAAARSAAAAMTAARADAFEALFAAAPLPLILAGRDGGIRHENDAARALFGESAPGTLALRVAGPDRNRVATTEERRRRGARGVPGRYRAAVLDANGAGHPCLIAAVYRKPEEATLLAFVDLGPATGFDVVPRPGAHGARGPARGSARVRRRRPGRIRRGGPGGLACSRSGNGACSPRPPRSRRSRRTARTTPDRPGRGRGRRGP